MLSRLNLVNTQFNTPKTLQTLRFALQSNKGAFGTANRPLQSEESLKEEALNYHATPVPGKYTIKTNKPMNSQKDLSLAYTPGVAVPCMEINRDKENAYLYTNKGNMVAVITNGTAVLGLGNIGALAGKPVMEGKSALFNKFAGVESIDLSVDT
jgi:malate dehydrogenase (oxaloacetate-decarboxylating)(NADP+)